MANVIDNILAGQAAAGQADATAQVSIFEVVPLEHSARTRRATTIFDNEVDPWSLQGRALNIRAPQTKKPHDVQNPRKLLARRDAAYFASRAATLPACDATGDSMVPAHVLMSLNQCQVKL